MRAYETYSRPSLGKIMDTFVSISILAIPSTYAEQMLYVSIYDLLRAYLEDEIQYIGENGLIDVRSGRVSWEKQLDIEIGN